MGREAHWAVYGDVIIRRGYCSDCETYAFIVDEELQCCGAPCGADKPECYKQMSQDAAIRHKPPRKMQDRILSEQCWQCFYCDRKFGTKVWRLAREIALRLEWDHVSPFIYSLSNKEQNYVAACHVCNHLKASMIFGASDEARVYIASKWKEKGYSDLPPLRIKLRPETNIAKVL